MKLMKVLFVLALVFAVSAVAHAETQSIKVSGDLTMRAFARGDYDLWSSSDQASDTISSKWSTFFTSTAEVQVDADLTDNVAAVVRLVNQRVWGDNQYHFPDGAAYGTNRVRDNSFDVSMDLAYIELKEFMYSPLTLRIGRQNLWFGRGFIVGNSLMDPQDSGIPREYTAINSFDAVRGTLDLDPWTIDMVYAKIAENNLLSDDDVNLMGLNVGYLFDVYNAEAEAYYWWNRDRNPDPQFGSKSNNDTHVFGARGSFDPIEDWTIALEGAYQTGQSMNPMSATQDGRRTRSAWAMNAMVECRYFQEDFAWKPVMAAEWIYYSGESDLADQGPDDSSHYKGWNPLYRGKFDTAIREFQGWMYGNQSGSTPSYTNQHQILVSGTVEPTDSLQLKAVYANFWTDRPVNSAVSKSHIGQEVDVQLLWDYTEDVQFGLLAAWFFPGKHLDDMAKAQGSGPERANATATSIVGTVSLSF